VSEKPFIERHRIADAPNAIPMPISIPISISIRTRSRSRAS